MFDSGFTSSFQVDFGLKTRWPEYTYIYLYEMFYKAEVLKNDHNFFRPVSQLKTSVIVWYLLNPVPPSQSVSHLTASQAKSIWGLTDEELESNYHESDRGECWLLYNLVPQTLLLIMEEDIINLVTCSSYMKDSEGMKAWLFNLHDNKIYGESSGCCQTRNFLLFIKYTNT